MSANPAQSWAQLLMFTGYLESDNGAREFGGGEKQAMLVDLSKQFRFPIYDTFPHPIYGDQNLAYFDPYYNLTNPSADGVTWVCDGKMFTESNADMVFGSSHIDPAVYIDTSGGSAPTSSPLANGTINVIADVWTGTNYTFYYHTGTVVLKSPVPTTSVVSMAGNPTWMAPEVMIRKMLVEKAQWDPAFLQLDTSGVLLPQFQGQDQSIWTCIKYIAAMTAPRLVSWVVWVDEVGNIKFYETRFDGPPVKSFLDEKDLLSLTYQNSSQDLQTVVRADSTCSTQQGDQAVSSIAYNVQSINKYGQTTTDTIDQGLLGGTRCLTTTAAISYLNVLTAAVLASVSHPVNTITTEIWPDPSLEIGDKVQIRDMSTGIMSYFIITQMQLDVTPGDMKQTLTLTEFYEPANFSFGIPNTVGIGNTQGATTAAPATGIIGAVGIGNTNGLATYAFNFGDYVYDQSGDIIVPIWTPAAGECFFNIFLASQPASTTTTGQPQTPVNTPTGQYGLNNLPPGCNWVITPFHSGSLTGQPAWAYGISPGPSTTYVGYPPVGNHVYCSYDNIFYYFTHSLPIGTPDSNFTWTPGQNVQTPVSGGTQNYTGQASTVYLWQWWYMCLDSANGVGKNYRPIMRLNPSLDGQAISVGSTGGSWVTETWTDPPGPKLSSPTTNFNKTYGNLVIGQTTDYPTAAGFVGSSAPISADGGTTTATIGVAYGADAAYNYYVGYQKMNKAHLCLYALTSIGTAQFLRIPFWVVV